MATNFPGSVDNASTVGDGTHPSADELLSSTDGGPAHHALHQNVGLAINAIEDKVGTGASTPVVGSVLTGTGSGTSAWSNAPLYVDTTNNRVAINATSFGAEFEVHGSSNPELRIRSTDASDPALVFGDAVDAARASIFYDTSENRLHFRGYDNANRMVIDSDGNVGIGTTSPETPLNIVTTNKLGSTFTGTTAGEGLRVDQNSYTADNYVSLVEGSRNAGGNPNVRIGAQFTGSGSKLVFGTSANYSTGVTNTALTIDPSGKVGIGTTTPSTKLDVNGSLSKNSGSFKIPHPLPEMTETHNLVHSFVEAPQADNIYRGRVALEGGSASVDIDEVAGMTAGTFVLLNRDVQAFTSNETGPCRVWSSVSDGVLTITAEHDDCDHEISWLVIGERQDQHMYDTEWTDDDGRVIVEPVRLVESEIDEAA